MNKVVRSISITNEEPTVQEHKNAITVKIDTYGVVSKTITIAEKNISLDIKFIDDSDGTGFNTWLQSYFTAQTVDFESANVNIYDCRHDTNEACDNLLNWDL